MVPYGITTPKCVNQRRKILYNSFELSVKFDKRYGTHYYIWLINITVIFRKILTWHRKSHQTNQRSFLQRIYGESYHDGMSELFNICHNIETAVSYCMSVSNIIYELRVTVLISAIFLCSRKFLLPVLVVKYVCPTSVTGDTDIADTANRPLARYVKLRVAHAPGMLGTYSPPLTSKETVS